MADFWSDLDNRVQQQAAQGANHNWSAWQARLDSQQAQQPTKKKKGFWQDQISTGGSIAGALGGAAAGTAILPGVGTLIGALLGGAAGGAGGQAAENAIVGDELGKDVLSEALWGGATALPFGAVGKLGKAGLTVAKGAGSQAAKTAAMDLVNQAAVKTMPTKTLTQALAKGSLPQGMQDAAKAVTSAPTLSQKLGQKLTGAADDFAIKQFRFTPTQLTNFNKKFGEDAGQTVRRYGFNSAEDIAAKGIDPLQEQFGALVKGIGAIPTATIKDNLENSVKKLATSATSDNQAVAKQVQAEAKNLLKRFGSTVDANELNTIRREFDSLVNYTQSVANPSRYSVNKRVADVLRSTLQQADATGKLKGVGQEISKLRNLSDMAERQGNLGRGSLPLNLASAITGAGGASIGGVTGMAAGMVAANAANSPIARKLAMKAVDKMSGKLSSNATKDIGQTLKQAAIRVGGAGVAKSFGNQSSVLNNTADNAPMNITTTIPSTDQNIQSQYPDQQQMSSPLGVSSTDIGQALMRAYVAGDAPAIKQLQGMYELASQLEKSQSDSLSQSSRNAMASSDNAINTVDQLQQLYQSAGGARGRIGGAIGNFAADAGLDSNAKSYNSLRDASVTQIAKALAGAGAGTVSDMDAKVIIAALPTIQDTPEEAATKFAALRARLANARSNTYMYGSGGDASALVNALQSV